MLPREQWRIVVKDKYPAYVSWQTYETIQAMLRDPSSPQISPTVKSPKSTPRSGSIRISGTNGLLGPRGTLESRRVERR